MVTCRSYMLLFIIEQNCVCYKWSLNKLQQNLTIMVTPGLGQSDLNSEVTVLAELMSYTFLLWK